MTLRRPASADCTVPDELAAAIAEKRAILFAGAGLSMNVGLPSWREFIDQMGRELGLAPERELGPGTSHHDRRTGH